MSTQTSRATAPGADSAPRRPAGVSAIGRRLASWTRNGGLSALLFSLPLLLVFAYFAWGPIVQGLALSFQKTNFLGESTWVGLDNFERLFRDPLLGVAVGNTLAYAALTILIGFPLPVLLAVMIGELRRAKAIASALVYIPVVLPPVVAVLLWTNFYSPAPTGLFNTVLSWFGVDPVGWLQTAETVIPSIVIQSLWAGMGTSVIIYLAALTAVAPELYEAAEIDGARLLHKVWHVTLPQLRNIMLLLLLLELISVFQIFTQPFVMTGGGPANRSTSVLILVFNYAFVNGDYGKATALSLLLALGLSVISAAYLFATRKWKTQ